MTSDDPEQSGSSFPEIESRKSFLRALTGMKIAGRYEVVKVLGEGGMGVVALARHTELEQSVAIKFMFPEFLGNEVLSARFSREAKLAAKVHSPHIVRVSDVGRLPSGVPYLVMDLLAGHDLGAELDEKGVLPVERAVDYILQACAGIAALHAIGVVHRDLKPSNLFVAEVAGGTTLKVLDFGISKDVTTPSATLTTTETQLGTPMYMSPEQIRSSKDVDTRSDIWSLGVILYELLTGALPFARSGHSIGEIFAMILMTDPVPLCVRRPELPRSLEAVVMRCLRRTSWERFESVAALAEALRPFTRASSIHRIDAVAHALGVSEPSTNAPDEVRRAAAVTPNIPVTPPRVAAAATARTMADDPIREPTRQVDGGPSQAPTPPRRHDPLASPSLVSSSRQLPLPGATPTSSRGSGLVVALGTAAAVVGAGLTFAFRTSAPPAAHEERSSGLVGAESPPVVANALVAPVIANAPVAAPEEPAPPPAVTTLPSALPPPATPRVQTAPKRPASAPRPTTTKPTPSAASNDHTDDLILDRR